MGRSARRNDSRNKDATGRKGLEGRGGEVEGQRGAVGRIVTAAQGVSTGLLEPRGDAHPAAWQTRGRQDGRHRAARASVVRGRGMYAAVVQWCSAWVLAQPGPCARWHAAPLMRVRKAEILEIVNPSSSVSIFSRASSRGQEGGARSACTTD